MYRSIGVCPGPNTGSNTPNANPLYFSSFFTLLHREWSTALWLCVMSNMYGYGWILCAQTHFSLYSIFIFVTIFLSSLFVWLRVHCVWSDLGYNNKNERDHTFIVIQLTRWLWSNVRVSKCIHFFHRTLQLMLRYEILLFLVDFPIHAQLERVLLV